MTIKEILNKAELQLAKNSSSSALDSELILAFTLGKERSFVLANEDKDVGSRDAQRFNKLVKKRADGCPVAYILGKKEFYGLDFLVDEHVLIPRPETEKLVEFAVSEIKRGVIQDKIKNLRIIDVGTGSGNIGISIIHEVQELNLHKLCSFEFILSDVSEEALRAARNNRRTIIGRCKGIKIQVVKSDLLKDVIGKFDIIISNPPYIPEEQIEFLQTDVRDFEPLVALSGGKGGTGIITRLIVESTERLKSNGVLLFEMHEEHYKLIPEIIQKHYPNWVAQVIKDDFGQPRFCRVKKKGINVDRLT